MLLDPQFWNSGETKVGKKELLAKELSHAQKQEALSDLAYEVDMFFEARRRLSKPIQDKSNFTTSAYIESAAIHLRGIVDFLSCNVMKDTDVTARTYLTSWNPKPLPETISAIRKRVNTEVGHITTLRLMKNGKDRFWNNDLERVANYIRQEFARFVTEIERDFDVAKLKSIVARYPGSPMDYSTGFIASQTTHVSNTMVPPHDPVNHSNSSDVNYLSLITVSMLQPMGVLWDRLSKSPHKDPNDVQTSSTENGFSVAICVLAVMICESALARARVILSEADDIKQNTAKFNALDLYESLIESHTRQLAFHVPTLAELEEIWALRDALMHSHVWEACVITGSGELTFAQRPNPFNGFGDRRFRRVIDWGRRKTNVMALNLFPPRVCRTDAYFVTLYANLVTRFLESIDRRVCYLGVQPIRSRKPSVSWDDFVDKLGQSTLSLHNKQG